MHLEQPTTSTMANSRLIPDHLLTSKSTEPSTLTLLRPLSGPSPDYRSPTTSPTREPRDPPLSPSELINFLTPVTHNHLRSLLRTRLTSIITNGFYNLNLNLDM